MFEAGPWRLYALLLFLGLSSQSRAADFTCVQPAWGRVVNLTEAEPYNHGDPSQLMELLFKYGGYYAWDRKDSNVEDFSSNCWRVAIQGKITTGDASKLEWILTNKRPPGFFLLQSPGGNLLEAMTMGRLLRTAFANVEASKIHCGGNGEPVCCASACALVYFGGARWNPTDRLGLHRPTLEDLGEVDYSKARRALEDASVLVGQYFKEMEIDAQLLDAMMRAGPDELVILALGKKYPPSLQDWLMAKCKTDGDKDDCMDQKLRNLSGQQYPEYKEARRFSWYSYKSKSDLKKMLSDDAIGPITSAAAERELESRRKILIPEPGLVRSLDSGGDIRSIAITGDGRFALSGSYKTVKLWDLSSGQVFHILNGHHGPVNSIATTPDGHYGFSGSSDGHLRLWDLAAGRELRTLYASPEVGRVALSVDGKYGLSAEFDGKLKLWDLSNGQEVRTLAGDRSPILAIAFTDDGRGSISASMDTVKLWDLSSGHEIRSFALNSSPKGALNSELSAHSVAVAPHPGYVVSGHDDGTLKLWDLSTGREIRSFVAHKSVVTSVAVSSDGHYATSGGCASFDEDKDCEAGSLKVWELTTGKQLHEFLGHIYYVHRVAVTPDAHFAFSSGEKTLKLWDLSEWTRSPEARH
ncbi:MAG: hypothetical protein WBX25_12830 [Rhodomicrobium sp.]